MRIAANSGNPGKYFFHLESPGQQHQNKHPKCIKMFATLFIVMLLFTNSLQEHKQENLTTVQKSSGSSKGGQSYCGWLPFLSDNVSN